MVRLSFDPRKEIDLLAIPRRLAESGFRPGKLRLRARGTFEEGRFRIDGWRTTFPAEGTSRATIEAELLHRESPPRLIVGQSRRY